MLFGSSSSRTKGGGFCSWSFLFHLLLVTCVIYMFIVCVNLVTDYNYQQLQSHNYHHESLRDIISCTDRPYHVGKVRERGNYTVYENAFPAQARHACHESITLTTQGDYTFLDNVLPLVERWQGPISVALYAPGDDFVPTLRTIAFLRNCRNRDVARRVSFHILYERQHFPKVNVTTLELLAKYNRMEYNCTLGAPHAGVKRTSLYKTRHHLPYPINVARNVALEAAQTHFVLAADMELIPSANIIPQFFDMITAQPQLVRRRTPATVFAFAVMEVTSDSTVPRDKTHLQALYGSGKAFFFAEATCSQCQGVPERKEWIADRASALPGAPMTVFAAAKRTGLYERWEPVYIGTHDEPSFDERVTWEGTTNKMIQAYVMCMLNYDFIVVSTSFFVHKPGRRAGSSQTVKDKKAMAALIENVVVPELRSIYGRRPDCVVGGEYTRKVN